MSTLHTQPNSKRPHRPGERLHASAIGLARCTVGALATLRAVDTVRIAGIDRVTAEKTAWLARLAGLRDLALGAGLLHALATGRDTDGWLWAGMIADAGDVAVFGAATRRGHLPPAVGLAMTATALGGVAAAIPLTLRHPTT